MKILYLSSYYAPEIAASSYIFDNIREACVEAGHEIVLYAPMPTRGISQEVRNKYKNIPSEEKYGGKLKIYRFPMFREGKNPFVRALRYFLCNIMHFYKGLISRDIDIITVASTPPTQGALAALLKKIKKIPVVYYLQDIFPDSLANTGLTKEGSFLWIIGRTMENFTYNNMDKIIVISQDMKENLINKGVPERKIHIIYNWVEADKIVPISKKDNILYKRYNLDVDIFYVVYAGNLGYAQNIEVMLKTAKLLQKNTGIKFLIFGKGAQEEEYKNLSQELDLNNVQFLPMQPYAEVSHVYSLADVSIVSCKAGFGGSGMPSKTWSIMSTGTPIIASFDEGSDLQRIIQENRVGLFAKADDKEGLKTAIETLYQDHELARSLGRNGREYILRHLTKNTGAKKYVQALEDCLKNN